MLDAVAERAIAIGIKVIYGYYFPTARNGMVADILPKIRLQAMPSPSSMSRTARHHQGDYRLGA